jgi:hypothetical protein
MNTQQAFETMAKRYNMVAMFNELAEIDGKLVNLVRDWFNYAVLMAKTNRQKELANMCYEFNRNGTEMNVDKLLDVEIEEKEIELIYQKFMENLKNFYFKAI